MRRTGFTLLEMILVLVVITIALFPLIESFSSGIRASKSVSDTNTAIELAQQKMEQLQSIFYEYKNETLDELTDDELIEAMKDYFDGQCQGSVEYLEETCLEELAGGIRGRSTKD